MTAPAAPAASAVNQFEFVEVEIAHFVSPVRNFV